MWPRAVRSADVLFCISQQTRQELDQFGGRIRRPVTVLPMGSDHVDSWAQSRKSSVTNPYVLHLAHRANKRPLLAIEAFLAASNRVDDSDRWRLVIVGLDDDRLRHLRRTHPRLVQDPRLRFFPPLEAREFSQVFAAAGCLLFTSEYEGYGLPVLEAARLGVSVVTTPVPAVTEGDVTGALVASGASSQIANLLGTVLSGEHDPSVAKRAVTDLVWARTADVLIDQLHEHLREIS